MLKRRTKSRLSHMYIDSEETSNGVNRMVRTTNLLDDYTIPDIVLFLVEDYDDDVKHEKIINTIAEMSIKHKSFKEPYQLPYNKYNVCVQEINGIILASFVTPDVH